MIGAAESPPHLATPAAVEDRQSSGGLVVAACGVAIFLSAFLLFLVEPMIGLVVLPVFGGVPGAWATILCFFQAVLVLGYLYGHLVVTRLGSRVGPLLHGLVASIALGATIVAPTRYAGMVVPDLPVAVNLLWMLAVTIGPAAFLMTTTTPLISSWYASLRPVGRSDPYWLYALSNAGSLLALLAYPLIVEPAVGLRFQRSAWLVGFGTLCLLLVLIAVERARTTHRARTTDPAALGSEQPGADADIATIRPGRQARWILLAAIPSGLLAAVTNFITTDLVSAPLLWVGPLAVYLASFIVVFSPRGTRLARSSRSLAPIAITLLWVPIGSAGAWPALALVVLELLAFAIVALALHGILAADRPPAAHLTQFYLLVSIGGVVGSSFVAIVAPIAFKGVWEYPILLVGAIVALAAAAERSRGRDGVSSRRDPVSSRARTDTRTVARNLRLAFSSLTVGTPRRIAVYLGLAAVVVAVLAADHSPAIGVATNWLVVGGLLLVFAARPAVLAILTSVTLVLGVFVLPPRPVFQDRGFFGVIRVEPQADGQIYDLRNGTTVHGSQWRDPARARQPLNEFATAGPAGDIFRVLRTATPAASSIGLVGLGAGALAAYTAPGDRLTAFEINPLDARAAQDPAYFTYLADAPAQVEVRIGDGRLLLEAFQPSAFDILFLDAFNSDAVPVHLLTIEAMASYLRTLESGGVLAFHLSNRYYDLPPVVTSAVESLGLTALVKTYEPSAAEIAEHVARSTWLVATTDGRFLGRLRNDGWTPISRRIAPLTDDYPDVVRLLRLPWS